MGAAVGAAVGAQVQEPPQSTRVSSPFFKPSLHVLQRALAMARIIGCTGSACTAGTHTDYEHGDIT